MKPEQLGPYRLDAPLGKGGMGMVYRAVHHDTGDVVALKVLSPRLAVAEGFRDRFEAEIESLKSLRHAGIVRLYGYGEQDGTLFYAMELVEGSSLEDELRNGRLFNWRETAQITLQVCRALKHAHDHGVIHRDIKPANILLSNNGRAKLADFGIARIFGSTSGTIAGGVVGTADYMSPEQAAGTPVTARCDQYSLGGVMYALLTGRPPFRADNLTAMLQLQRFAIPEPVSRFAPDTPQELERIVARMLEKDPAQRFPNTQVIARRIEAMSRALAKVAADDFELYQTAPTPLPSDGPSEVLPGDGTLAATLDASDKTPDGSSISLVMVDGATEVYTPPISTPTYTEVNEESERADEGGSWSTIGGQVAALVLVLVTLVGIAWWLTRPATADSLYDRIAVSVAADDPSAAALDTVSRFLRKFPNDPRSAEVAEWGKQLRIERLRRRHKLAKLAGSFLEDESPEEILLKRASRLANDDPDAAADVFNTLGDLIALGEEDPNLVELAALAESEAERLREVASAERKELAAYCEKKLEAAQELPPEDQETRRAVARAVIALLRASPETESTLEAARAIVAEGEP